jgi:hypothetical protein
LPADKEVPVFALLILFAFGAGLGLGYRLWASRMHWFAAADEVADTLRELVWQELEAGELPAKRERAGRVLREYEELSVSRS